MENEMKTNKNMTNCKACKESIAKGAKTCPNCGKDQRNFFMRHKFLTGFLILFLISSIGRNLSDDTDAPKSKGPKESVQDESVQDESVQEEIQQEFKVGEIISYKDFDLVFENLRNVTGLAGTNYTVLDATVTSKKDDFKFFGDIQGVNANNEVIASTIALVNEDLGDTLQIAWIKTLNNGQKATGYIAFDQEIEVIEVRSSQFKNDVIKIILD